MTTWLTWTFLPPAQGLMLSREQGKKSRRMRRHLQATVVPESQLHIKGEALMAHIVCQMGIRYNECSDHCVSTSALTFAKDCGWLEDKSDVCRSTTAPQAELREADSACVEDRAPYEPGNDGSNDRHNNSSGPRADGEQSSEREHDELAADFTKASLNDAKATSRGNTGAS